MSTIIVYWNVLLNSPTQLILNHILMVVKPNLPPIMLLSDSRIMIYHFNTQT